ncbi:MAG: peptidase, partial [Gemmatimonadetes bacterium]|nr:peptidase [Gemmatimonadota bacterium]
MRLLLSTLVLAALALPARAQDPLHRYSEAFEQRLDRSQPRLSYDVHVDPADYGAYAVTLTVRNAPDTLRLRLPIWAPGAYRVANFARNLRDLAVTVRGAPVPVSRDDSSAWTARVPRGAT